MQANVESVECEMRSVPSEKVEVGGRQRGPNGKEWPESSHTTGSCTGLWERICSDRSNNQQALSCTVDNMSCINISVWLSNLMYK